MKLEIFFDYACPYCYTGHHYLSEIAAQYPDLPLEWRPCESHPRPETYSVHSDMAIQGMYAVSELHGDLWTYHSSVYQMLFENHKDISDIEQLADCAVLSGVSREAFVEILLQNRYAQKVLDGNIYAWNTNKLDAVPSYRFGNLFIGSRNGILVSKQELNRFFLRAAALTHKG